MAVNINVYWGPRKRTAKDSIPQLQAHFRALAIADERLASWAPLGRSLKKAMASEPIDTSAASNLQHLLEKGQNKTDIAPRQPIPELGYRVSLWNQRRGNVEASTSIHCGAYSEYLSRDSQNNACLELNCMAGAEPFGAEVLLALFHRFVEILETRLGFDLARCPGRTSGQQPRASNARSICVLPTAGLGIARTNRGKGGWCSPGAYVGG
ncbi:MAG: hypothetical protein EOS63_29410 [Mesorhizobium sp.]|uniref:Imm52 family immunity protein n=1 Tax=Mesorhizobium sp. TaxID=1871066 RepID=UPI000FE63CB5|nr:Imm52 family immunity protein [Mesorhizobium sp.]RWE72902.1 MAG: hypothetical protein EOS63_29410 [Mesorhizobium sp.]TJW58325.1 MAG: hypothetical protein E5V97_33020 [Mesorhizobium sp.]